MKAKEIGALDGAAVAKLLADKRRELLRLHLRRSAGQVDKTHQFTTLRKDIARLCTVQSERDCAGRNQSHG